MAVLHFISHPQVRISADIAVPRWGLTVEGRQRIAAIASQPWMEAVDRLVSSDETKALETAAILAVDTSLTIDVRSGLRENDRSSTGFVPSERFEQLADMFFAAPDESVEGWETARAAQARVVQATRDLITGPVRGDVLISGHGGVGTLLLCHLLGVEISRDHDQTGPGSAVGGGNHWSFDIDAGRVRHGWRPIESASASRPA